MPQRPEHENDDQQRYSAMKDIAARLQKYPTVRRASGASRNRKFFCKGRPDFMPNRQCDMMGRLRVKPHRSLKHRFEWRLTAAARLAQRELHSPLRFRQRSEV